MNLSMVNNDSDYDQGENFGSKVCETDVSETGHQSFPWLLREVLTSTLPWDGQNMDLDHIQNLRMLLCCFWVPVVLMSGCISAS